MNAISASFTFASAYKQLQASERLFVDGYVADLEERAFKLQDRITNVLEQGPTAATVEASRGLLDRSMVRAAIVERVNDIALQSELTVFKLVRELKAIAFGSLGNVIEFDEYRNPVFHLDRATPEQWAAIASYEHEIRPRGGSITRIKMHAKQPAIDTLMKYTGALDPDNSHWRSENAKPVNKTTLPADTTSAGASDLYSRMING